MDLWNGRCSILHLTEVMRQKDDSFFAQMLNSLRIHTKKNFGRKRPKGID